MIAPTVLPFFAAVVQKPARSECPRIRFGSSPAAAATRCTIRATVRSLSARRWTRPPRSTARNTAPPVIRDASSHASSARTGHRDACEAYGIAFSPPLPFLVTLRPRQPHGASPSRVRVMSSSTSAASSDRRNAPSHPRVRSARSRKSSSSRPSTPIMAARSPSSSAAFLQKEGRRARRQIPRSTPADSPRRRGPQAPTCRCAFSDPCDGTTRPIGGTRATRRSRRTRATGRTQSDPCDIDDSSDRGDEGDTSLA